VPELAARVGLTALFVGLVWSFVLDAMWPPSRLWVVVWLLIAAVAWGGGWLWLRYFEEQSVQRERRERSARLDKPAGRQVARADEVQEVEPEVPEPGVWPPKNQKF
jgi:hypothetical protein